jgi:acyl carrier protein
MRPEPAGRLRDFVVEMIASACNADPAAIDMQAPLLDLGLDSLSLLAVVSQVEASYGVELLAEDTAGVLGAACVADLIKAMEARLSQKA